MVSFATDHWQFVPLQWWEQHHNNTYTHTHKHQQCLCEIFPNSSTSWQHRAKQTEKNWCRTFFVCNIHKTQKFWWLKLLGFIIYVRTATRCDGGRVENVHWVIFLTAAQRLMAYRGVKPGTINTNICCEWMGFSYPISSSLFKQKRRKKNGDPKRVTLSISRNDEKLPNCGTKTATANFITQNANLNWVCVHALIPI